MSEHERILRERTEGLITATHVGEPWQIAECQRAFDEALAALVRERDEARAALMLARDYQAAMSVIAYEWRLDWSDFDGRTLALQEADASYRFLEALAGVDLGRGRFAT